MNSPTVLPSVGKASPWWTVSPGLLGVWWLFCSKEGQLLMCTICPCSGCDPRRGGERNFMSPKCRVLVPAFQNFSGPDSYKLFLILRQLYICKSKKVMRTKCTLCLDLIWTLRNKNSLDPIIWAYAFFLLVTINAYVNQDCWAYALWVLMRSSRPGSHYYDILCLKPKVMPVWLNFISGGWGREQ